MCGILLKCWNFGCEYQLSWARKLIVKMVFLMRWHVLRCFFQCSWFFCFFVLFCRKSLCCLVCGVSVKGGGGTCLLCTFAYGFYHMVHWFVCFILVLWVSMFAFLFLL